jgi:aminoglycoside phosphotransferase (APT) family kinase protein
MFDIADAVEQLAACDATLLRGIRAFLRARLALVEEESAAPLHTDAHGFNVMIDGGHVVALIDWESAHHGAASTELDMVARYWGNGGRTPRAPGEAPPAITVADAVQAVDAIASGYPELFDLPRLRERLEFHDGLWKLHGLLVANFFGNPISWDEIEVVLDRATHLNEFAHLF